MKQIFAVGFAVVMLVVASTVSFAGSSERVETSCGDHEGKPCHAYYSDGTSCHCSSCYGNNWGNTYCTRCKHAVKYHY